MTTLRTTPGPDAASAFRLGVAAGAVVGLVGLGVLYLEGIITPMIAGYLLVVVFPVYLVLVAVALSTWLGYDKDASALRPVYKPKDPDYEKRRL